jgi:pyridoxal 5'-phosphate synthase pdxT subunit
MREENSQPKPRIGVLSLQGNFEAHARAVLRAGGIPIDVRTASDLATVDGLIIPGGESTAMLRLLDYEGLFEPLQRFGSEKPIFGTCAGAILLASDVHHPAQPSLQLIDIGVERNGYGRQIDSRIANIDVGDRSAEAVFIRAPIIRRVGPAAKVLATYLESPVLVEEGQHLVATFHPELSGDKNWIHGYFVDKVRSGKVQLT